MAQYYQMFPHGGQIYLALRLDDACFFEGVQVVPKRAAVGGVVRLDERQVFLFFVLGQCFFLLALKKERGQHAERI
ncbi:MAG: hypothetical protein ACKVU2_08895 [Saprospiraceae bacterium]